MCDMIFAGCNAIIILSSNRLIFAAKLSRDKKKKLSLQSSISWRKQSDRLFPVALLTYLFNDYDDAVYLGVRW